ncbi:hypothetical protein Tco_1472596, partial [Tanacetum coccineum]
MNSATSS